MNVRLRKDFFFDAGILFQDRYLINQYHVVLGMMTASQEPHQQNVAYERIKFWITEMMQNSVMIPIDHERIPAFVETGQRVLTLPDQPLDQIIGIMLCCKLNAICEDRMIITDVELSSSCGENMTYLHSFDENIGPFMSNGWWNDARPIYNNIHEHHDNITSLVRVATWKDLDLDWEETSSNDNTVVFADFKRDETK